MSIASIASITAIALGYPGDPGSLSDALQKRNAAPRSRREIGSFVHGVNWGETPPCLKR